MSRTLRGVASRGGALTTLFAMTVVVVAGTVTVTGFAGQAGTSTLLAVPLLLLGLVAVPSTGHELGSVRRGEIALARLRGLQGADLVRFLAAEPLIVLLAGAGAGFPLGVLGSWWAGRAWLADPAGPVNPVGAAGVLATVTIVAVALVAVLAGMTHAIREPLVRQVTTVGRASPAGVAGLFGSVLVLVAAAVSVYRSRSTGAGDPDWVVLAGPALVGLAAGQVAVWLVQVAAAGSMRRTARSGLPTFLAVRRLGRAADRVAPIRLLVAASTLAVVALTGAGAVESWTDDTARIRNGAALRIPIERGAAEALSLTRDLDPEGRWLMAAVVIPEEADSVARRAFVDTSRYAAVAGGFLADTPAAGVLAEVDALAPGPVPRSGSDAVMPILTSPQVGFVKGGRVNSPGGNERRAQVVGEVGALPLLDAAGALGDLPRALVGASPTVPAAEVMVLARADTPAPMLAALAEAGAGPPETLDQMTVATSAQAGSARARMYSLMALTCLPLALLVLAASAARQRRLAIREHAALRLLRVPSSDLRRAGRLEVGWLVGAVVTAATGGALVGVVLLLAQLPLVTPLPRSTPVHTGLTALPLLAVLLVAGLAMGWLGRLARTAPERLTRPAALREDGAR